MTATHYINAFLQNTRTFTYTSTRNFIVEEAFRKIGALGDGESLDATRLAIGVGVLNPMVKALSAYGLNLWALEKVSIPLSTWRGNPSIVVGPAGDFITSYKPLKLLECVRVDDTSSVPLMILAHKDYFEQTNKTETGTPTMIYFQPFSTYAVLSLWQPPDDYWDDKTIECTFQRQIGDLSSADDEIDFPAEWHEALIYQLAVRLAPNYGLPPSDRAILKQEAKDALELVLRSDQDEPSLFIKAGR